MAAVRWTRPQRGDVRQTQLGRGSLGQQDGLVVAALPEALGMDGHGDHQLAADARPAPAGREDGPERPRDAPVPGVLQLVQRPARGAGERRAPLELRQARRQVRGQPDRPAMVDLDPGAEMAQAVGAQQRALVAATGAGRRHQQVEQPIHGADARAGRSPRRFPGHARGDCRARIRSGT